MQLPFSRSQSNPAGRQIRKLLGRSYLRENRLEDALEVFLAILNDDPEDVDTLLVMANLYRASGSSSTARLLYHQVKALSPDSPAIRLPLEIDAGCSSTEEEEVYPLGPDSLARLTDRLRQRDAQNPGDIPTAADLIEGHISSACTEQEDGKTSAELLQLMPALIEMNVREARAAGQMELAESLQSLRHHISRQSVKPAPRGPELDEEG